MARFESFSGEITPVSYETLPIGENAVQAALIELWSKKENIPDDRKNAYALAWIISGMSAKFRDYADEHPDETVSQTEEEIDALLERIVDFKTLN